MKILVITNLFPPYAIGGYELNCADTARELAKAGHRVYVLTGCGRLFRDENIIQELALDLDLFFRRYDEFFHAKGILTKINSHSISQSQIVQLLSFQTRYNPLP